MTWGMVRGPDALRRCHVGGARGRRADGRPRALRGPRVTAGHLRRRKGGGRAVPAGGAPVAPGAPSEGLGVVDAGGPDAVGVVHRVPGGGAARRRGRRPGGGPGARRGLGQGLARPPRRRGGGGAVLPPLALRRAAGGQVPQADWARLRRARRGRGVAGPSALAVARPVHRRSPGLAVEVRWRGGRRGGGG